MPKSLQSLPDVIEQTKVANNPPLKWVGMEKIGLPISYTLQNGDIRSSSAQVDTFVSLDTSAKGIHMSRLYLHLNEILANQTVNQPRLNSLLDTVLASHQGLSKSAMIRLEFEMAIDKPALLSENSGYQVYPIVITHKIVRGHSETQLELTIPYSSTCPCSVSLANQLISQSISQQFQGDLISKEALMSWLTSKEAQLATPHNQRSYAYLKLDLANNPWPDLQELIVETEAAIGTPVQTAVKREDEQEFARLNGANQMFCEDAARKVKRFLETKEELADYWFKVEHQESLHAHNAVAIDYK